MTRAVCPVALAALAAAGTLAGCVSTGAGDPIEVPAGRSSEVTFSFTLDPRTCQYGRVARPRFVQPEHGTVTTRAVTRRIGTVIGPKARKCSNETVRGVEIVYTPDPGYRGPDQFVVRTSLGGATQNRRTTSTTYRVIVQ